MHGTTTKTLALTAMLGALFATAPQVQAVTISCPGTAANTDREFRLTTQAASTCLAFGTGNFDNSPTGAAHYQSLGWNLLDKSDDTSSGSMRGTLDIDYDWLSDDNGDFSIDQSVWNAYSEVLFVMKSGTAQWNPDWAVFVLGSGTLSGDWDIDTPDGRAEGLSHVNIYGRGGYTQVPEPSTAALLGAGLFGLAWLRRRRREISR